jgi:hypothetical protein
LPASNVTASSFISTPSAMIVEVFCPASVAVNIRSVAPMPLAQLSVVRIVMSPQRCQWTPYQPYRLTCAGFEGQVSEPDSTAPL